MRGTENGNRDVNMTRKDIELIMIISLLSLSLLFSAGCTDKDPVKKKEDAEPGFLIHADQTKGIAPMTVVFTLANVTGEVISYRWDFGDDTADDGSDPDSDVTHKYTGPGRYEASVEVEFQGAEYVTRSLILHVSSARSVSSSLSVSEEESYEVDVDEMASGVELELHYEGGQNVGGKYQNRLDMYLYYPNGTLYDSTDDQEPSGSSTLKTLSITYQYLAASEFKDWSVSIKAKSGINVDYVYVCRVNY